MNSSKFNTIIVATTSILILQNSYSKDSYSTSDVNLLANTKRIISSSINNNISPWGKTTTFKTEGNHLITMRTDFVIENPASFSTLEFTKSKNIKDMLLNGKPIPIPLEGMRYRIIPGIPASMLIPGTNQLQLTWNTKVKKKINKETASISFSPRQIAASDIDISLMAHPDEKLKFQTGPLLGYVGKKFFTLSCRVNIPATVELKINKRKYSSARALMHSFKIENLSANTSYKYTLTASLNSNCTKIIGPFSVKTLPKGEPFKFAILGDSRSNPSDWAKVANALAKQKPSLAVFVGDMISNGRNDYEWDEQFYNPAKELLATTPLYGIVGNHEENSPLFPHFFKTPEESKNWSQEIGSVLLISIDGEMNWSKNSKLANWLEQTLSKSKADYIFLSSHYPAWSSGCHGWIKDGHPGEPQMQNAQEVIMPLLKKYNATAMFAGHDHFYERSEPENGVTMIVTGGAGAPLRPKAKNAAKQNPYSKVFASKLHYCMIYVDKKKCVMEVRTPDGEVIDTKIWPSRKIMIKAGR